MFGGMILLIGIVLLLFVIGVVVVLRSGQRQIELDMKDHELSTPSSEFQVLPRLKAEPDEQIKESWTLDSSEDIAHDHEGE